MVSAPSSVDVANRLASDGAISQAMLVLRASMLRAPSKQLATEAMRIASGGVSKSTLTVDLSLVDRCIRDGRLVEALVLLTHYNVGAEGREWSNLLGELLAPVPAHAEPIFVQVESNLHAGAASVALVLLEERAEIAVLPPWAERRLALLRWMLLDNAERAKDDSVVLPSGSPWKTMMAAGIQSHDLAYSHASLSVHIKQYPADIRAKLAFRHLDAIVVEMMRYTEIDAAQSGETVPLSPRASAAMQLQLANLGGAESIYRSLVDEGLDADAIHLLHHLASLRSLSASPDPVELQKEVGVPARTIPLGGSLARTMPLGGASVQALRSAAELRRATSEYAFPRELAQQFRAAQERFTQGIPQVVIEEVVSPLSLRSIEVAIEPEELTSAEVPALVETPSSRSSRPPPTDDRVVIHRIKTIPPPNDNRGGGKP